MDKHQQNQHLEGREKCNDIDKEVDEVSQVVEEVHVVGDDESSTDKHFDLGEHAIQHDEPEEGSEYESTREDDVFVDDSVEDPMEYTQKPRMLREFDLDLDGDMWQSTGAHMDSAMMVAEQVGVRMMKEYFEIKGSKATPHYEEGADTVWRQRVSSYQE